MGAVCPGGTARSRSVVHHERSSGRPRKSKGMKNYEDETKGSSYDMDGSGKMQNLYDSGELRFSGELKPSTPARFGAANMASQASSFLGKASIVGLEKAVEVIDTLGCSVANLNNSGFIFVMGSKGNGISILAFEVANTITKAVNLLQSLSKENVQFLKDEILRSKSVQELISTDKKELLSIAAADKRAEFKVFSQEVVRFGNMCKDPQWHNLDRYFSTLDSNPVSHEQFREEADMTMQELVTLAQHTSELYHEFHSLDRFEQEYRKKIVELDSLSLPRKGESLMMFHSDVKHQRKLVRGLKKKSLWSKSLEEVVEKLVDIVIFIHQKILEAFGDGGLMRVGKEPAKKRERLGVSGLALHYANLITKIDNIALRPTSLPPGSRDALYNALPPAVKTALRSRLQAPDMKKKLTVAQIKAEMEKTLEWLVPVATDTTKAHQGFGWVGEWANNGNELLGKKGGIKNSFVHLQTLYHADKTKMDSLILELVAFLHRLITLVKHNESRALPARSPTHKGLALHIETPNAAQLSLDDINLLEEVTRRRMLAPGRSKSQEFSVPEKGRNQQARALSRSAGSSPRAKMERPKANANANTNALDILDGIHSRY